MKSRARILLMLMAFLTVMSPAASAQSTPEALPADGSQPAVVESPAIPDGTTPDESAPAGASTPEADSGDDETPPADSGDADTPAEGDVAPAGMTSRQGGPDIGVMAVGDGTIIVDVAGSDPGQPVPTNALVCISVIWNCVPWTGAPLTFEVPAGEYTISFDQMDDSYYTDTNTTVTVGAGETLNVLLTLEPRQPSTLRLYVSTDTGAPLPAGTQACIQQDATAYTEAVDECQPVELFAVDFSVNEGWVDVQIVTPLGSGFGGASDTIWVPGGMVHRSYFVIADDADAVVTIDVATEDGLNLSASPIVCFQHATESLENCSWVGAPVFDGDGGGNFTFQVPAGTWTWVVEPSLDTQYLPVSGTVTVADGDELTIEAVLPLRTAEDVATMNVDVTTFTGDAVPAGTEVCVSDVLDVQCETWAGSILGFTVAAGPVAVQVVTPDDSGYTSYSNTFPLVLTGETLNVLAVLYSLDTPLTIEKYVSNEAPEVGDVVSYTIHAYGPAFEFMIEDFLPAELVDINVMCSGAFTSPLPGRCYELVGNVIVVPGISGNIEFMDVVLTVTGTVIGTPGTTVTNVACVTSFVWTGDEEACDTVDFVIAESAQPSPSPTPVPSETPVPGETPVPTTPAKPTTPQDGTPVVTKLPSTGDTGSSASPVALYAVVASAVMLAGAGLVRLRETTQG